jgi:hypothetical protein
MGSTFQEQAHLSNTGFSSSNPREAKVSLAPVIVFEPKIDTYL